MKDFELKYRQFGSQAILIEWPQKIDLSILKDIRAFRVAIQQNLSTDLEEAVPAYASLTLFFHYLGDVAQSIRQLKKLYSERKSENLEERIWHMPVCYDLRYGIDLEEIALKNSLSIEEIVRVHTAKPYQVYFIGFLPGFLYLGGLDKNLHFARKDTPRLQIKKGSVGIGNSQTGIYPVDSPGGWNIIGRTPIDLFNKNNVEPCFIKPGDQVQFHSVSLEDYEQIVDEVDNGNFNLKVETI